MYTINPDKNNISDSGAIILAKALDQITHLAILSLDTNKIADDGALMLANTILKQKEMKELYLCNILISL